jgi:hypothetical protein
MYTAAYLAFNNRLNQIKPAAFSNLPCWAVCSYSVILYFLEGDQSGRYKNLMP